MCLMNKETPFRTLQIKVLNQTGFGSIHSYDEVGSAVFHVVSWKPFAHPRISFRRAIVISICLGPTLLR